MMQPLPKDFLVRMARDYNLSEEQEEAFVTRFSSNKSHQEVADALHISKNAFTTRMTGVYAKFSFGGRVPNKSPKLHDFLSREYQKENPDRSIPDEEDSDALVREVREKIKPDIQQRCGTMKVLDMTQAIDLDDIYTEVNILEKITGRRRLGLAEFQKSCRIDSRDFDRLGLGKISEPRVKGIDAVRANSKLMIWGKPGSGKTTFLKYIAIHCIKGFFFENKLPVFIRLRDINMEKNKINLYKYIEQIFLEKNRTEIEFLRLLQKQRLLILLDGLDEVREEYGRNIIHQIQNISDRYCGNHFVVTCRIAAKEYTFRGFKEVEISDFSKLQIQNFVNKWFKPKELIKADRFIKKIKENKAIEELATNPLLLTLLCIVFEENFDFPQNRTELYEEGINLMLKKWDGKRNIERGRVYKNLSPKRIQDLLSIVAFQTFDRKDYFFKQREIENFIADYIRNLPNAQTDPEILDIDSEKILEAIEAKYGLLVKRSKTIYSFSHLTFHEYFTARKIVTHSKLEIALQNLAKHSTEYRWREVILLVAEMLPNSDQLFLLIKQSIDTSIKSDEQLQDSLKWINQQSLSTKITYKNSTLRFFYVHFILPGLGFGIDFNWNFESTISYSKKLGFVMNKDSNYPILKVDHAFLYIFKWIYWILTDDGSSIWDNERLCQNFHIELNNSFQIILDVIPETREDIAKIQNRWDLQNMNSKYLKQWWKKHGQNWTQDLIDLT